MNLMIDELFSKPIGGLWSWYCTIGWAVELIRWSIDEGEALNASEFDLFPLLFFVERSIDEQKNGMRNWLQLIVKLYKLKF